MGAVESLGLWEINILMNIEVGKWLYTMNIAEI
jgi:hypothetical protein